METWVINLVRAQQRKEYMEQLLKQRSCLAYSFVDAVNGYELDEVELDRRFDRSLSFKRYGRNLNAGEIGCTLSHFTCYERLLSSSSNYVLILEDDITFLHDEKWIQQCASEVDTEAPTILFLSGDYWYRHLKPRENAPFSIADVYDAVGSYAYLINKAAARLILDKNRVPSSTADHWSLYRRQGVRLKAVYPYVIDANIENLESTIQQTTFGEVRSKMSLGFLLDAYWNALRKKILLRQGKFVCKIRKR